MKTFRRLCFALALTVAFTLPALADGGITQGPGAPSASTDPGDSHSPGRSTTGIIHTPGLVTILLAISSIR
jgi:hypothetical protein